MIDINDIIKEVGTDTSGKWMAVDRLEEFAELIIKECADIATINSNQWHGAGSYVLKHFGIE